MPSYFFDLESDGLLEDITKLHSLVLINMDTRAVHSFAGELGWGFERIEKGLKMLMEADMIVGHNIIKYDIPAIQKLYPWFKPKAVVRDTLVCTRLVAGDLFDRDVTFNRTKKAMGKPDLCLPGKQMGSHSLKAWGIRLGEHKGDFSENADWSTWTPEMQSYCEQDVRVTARLWDWVKRQEPTERSLELEHRFAEIIAMQERQGFAFNVKAGVDLYQRLVKRRLELAQGLKEAFPPETVEETFIPKVNNAKQGYVRGVPFTKTREVVFNPSSRQMIAKRLRQLGWEPEEYTPTGEAKIDETVLSRLPYPQANLLAEHFLIEKRIGQLAEGDQAWLRLERNGRIHGSVNTNGAVTGRCTHSRPNVAQVPSVGAPYGEECRALFHASKGMKQVGIDLSGLELRCLAHFMAKWDGGAYGEILLTGDIHWANVQALGLVEGERDDTQLLHKLARNGAKTFIYAFLYGAGDEQIGSVVLDIIMGLKKAGLPWEDLAKKYFGSTKDPDKDALKRAGSRLKKSFLSKTPAILKLKEAVTEAAKKGFIIGLDGRKLTIRSAHAALNTLLQSAGALIAKQATINAYDELSARGFIWGVDYAQVAHVHDEMQFEAREGIEETVGQIVVEAMQKAGRDFNFRLPIDGEFKTGNNWKDCH